MDSGLLKPGEEDYPKDIYQATLPEEIIGIMDQLLSSEVLLLIVFFLPSFYNV